MASIIRSLPCRIHCHPPRFSTIFRSIIAAQGNGDGHCGHGGASVDRGCHHEARACGRRASCDGHSAPPTGPLAEQTQLIRATWSTGIRPAAMQKGLPISSRRQMSATKGEKIGRKVSTDRRKSSNNVLAHRHSSVRTRGSGQRRDAISQTCWTCGIASRHIKQRRIKSKRRARGQAVGNERLRIGAFEHLTAEDGDDMTKLSTPLRPKEHLTSRAAKTLSARRASISADRSFFRPMILNSIKFSRRSNANATRKSRGCDGIRRNSHWQRRAARARTSLRRPE